MFITYLSDIFSLSLEYDSQEGELTVDREQSKIECGSCEKQSTKCTMRVEKKEHK